MKNTIEYYYNFDNVSLLNSKDKIYVKSNNDIYIFCKVVDQEEVIEIYRITQSLDGIHKFVINKDNSIFTRYKNDFFVLLKVYSGKNFHLSLGQVQLQEKNYKLDRSNWYELWSRKNDYFEYQYKYTKKSNNKMSESLNYYIGMAENAIAYINQNLQEETSEQKKLCHKRVDKDNYLNPLFYVIDYKERELCEYLKYLFISKRYFNVDIEKNIKEFGCGKEGYIRLFGRMLYPSFYFDQYERIINENESESQLIEIIKRTKEYEEYLKEIYSIINKYTHIKKVEWL